MTYRATITLPRVIIARLGRNLVWVASGPAVGGQGLRKSSNSAPQSYCRKTGASFWTEECPLVGQNLSHPWWISRIQAVPVNSPMEYNAPPKTDSPEDFQECSSAEI